MRKSLVRKNLKRNISLILVLLLIQSCGYENYDIAKNEISNTEDVDDVMNTIGDVISKEYDIYYETKPNTINYTNPKDKKYVGAYIENPIYKGDISDFEDVMGEHSMYVYDFNLDALDVYDLQNTVSSCILEGAIPYIILTSNSAIYEMNIEDLEKVLEVLKDYDWPMVIELLPYQLAHNYNTELYKLFYIQAYELIKTANTMIDVAYPLELRNYYRTLNYTPDSEYFDYVSLRLDVDSSMTEEKMMYLLRSTYELYLDKPKILNVAVSHYNPIGNDYYSEEAYSKMNKLYSSIEEGYENIVSINYMDYTYNEKNQYPFNERYSLTGITNIVEKYTKLKDKIGFNKKINLDYDDKCITKLSEVAINVNGEVYLPNSTQDLLNLDLETEVINGLEYINLKLIKESLNNKDMNNNLILDEENGKIIISA